MSLSPENNRALNFLCQLPDHGNTTVEKADLREIMLTTGGSVMARGRLYNIKAAALGAGVYKLTMELANP